MKHCHEMMERLYEVRAINRAIHEHCPQADQVMALVECDARHVAALTHLFSLMNWPFPDDRREEAHLPDTTPATLVSASVAAERECLRAYDAVLASTRDATVRAVVGNLRNATLQWRLSAIEGLSDPRSPIMPPGPAAQAVPAHP